MFLHYVNLQKKETVEEWSRQSLIGTLPENSMNILEESVLTADTSTDERGKIQKYA
jgi:hypothetical protein